MEHNTAKRLEQFYKKAEDMNARITAGTEENRKARCTLTVTKDGAPLSGVHVSLTQKTHEFRFGANCFLLDEMESDEKNRLYRTYLAKAANLVTVPFYWNTLEPEQGHPRYAADSPKIYRRPPIDLCMDFCEQNGIEPKLHCLNYDPFAPDWYMKAPVPLQKQLLENRMRDIAGRYAHRIPCVEVTNEHWWGENRTSAFYREPDFMEWSYKTAENYFPNNFLTINEGQDRCWTEADFPPTRQSYYLLLENAFCKGLRIDRIGMQFHIWKHLEDNPNFYDPDALFATMDTYGSFGKELQVTEITLPAKGDLPEDEDYQAELLKHYYRIWFSHKNMQAIIYWNLWDGYAYAAPIGDMTQGENIYYGGLIRFDGTPKKAYHTLTDLIHKEWHTACELQCDEGGCTSFRGFYGDYDAVITLPDGKPLQTTFTLTKYGKKTLTLSV